MTADHDAARAIAKQQIEKAMRDYMRTETDPRERRLRLAAYLHGAFDLDSELVDQYLGREEERQA